MATDRTTVVPIPHGRPAGTNEFDDDEDGLSECVGDCDDALGTLWSPGAALVLKLGKGEVDAAILSWTVAGDPGGAPGTLLYDTFRRSNPSKSCATGWLCLESAEADSSTIDLGTPDPGAAYFHLVRAENTCGAQESFFPECP